MEILPEEQQIQVKELTQQKQYENTCVICQCQIARKGVIEICNHYYCFECIMKWSERSHQCPQCRLDFVIINEWVEDKKTEQQGKNSWIQHTALPIIDFKKEQFELAHMDIDNSYYQYILQQIDSIY